MLNNESRRLKNLILITNHFPFGFAENFLENEIPYLTKEFDQLIILTRDTHSINVRNAEKYTYHRIDTRSNFTERLLTAAMFLKNIRRVWSYVSEEIKEIKKSRTLSYPVVKKLFHDLGKSLATSAYIKRIIEHHKLKDSVVIYSYWLNSSALAATFVNVKNINLKYISRAHGVDVYEQRHAVPYLSFRSTLARRLHRIFCISENGANHLRKPLDSSLHKKISVSRLGTLRTGISNPQKKSGEFHILSCSFLSPVKQVHLIIEALSFIENLHITWTHIGDGELRKDLEQLASRILNKFNIRYSFRGTLTNNELMRFYEDNYVDLFINTSKSEGIPVTMMEAQSFGIPITAPSVGGIPEIVNADNGRLFEPNASPETIARHIEEILTSPQYNNLRNNAFACWNEKYNAEKNFPTFVSEILSL